MTEIFRSARWAGLTVILSVVLWGYGRCERAAEIDRPIGTSPQAQNMVVPVDNLATAASSNSVSDGMESPSANNSVDQYSESLEQGSP